MSENLNSNNTENGEFNLQNEESDYRDLITRLKEIKSTIDLLEKKIFLFEIFFFHSLIISLFWRKIL